MKYTGVLILLLIVGCGQTNPSDRDQLVNEIAEVERQFNKMAAEKGIGEAFIHFAADSATLLRGKEIVKGKSAISKLFTQQNSGSASLVWEPDYIDVAASGDLAYTYGKYLYTIILESGDTITDQGIFHTVWKREEDGSWKYVWD